MYSENYKADQELFDAANGVDPIRASVRGLAIEVAKFRADSVILEIFEPMQLKNKEKTKTRDRFIKRYWCDFLPASKEEAELATRGLREKISDIARWAEPAKQGSSIQARYEQAVGYYEDTSESLQVLRRVFTAEEDSEATPDPVLIRDDPEVLSKMIGFYFRCESLDQYKWRPVPEEDEDALAAYFANSSDRGLLQYFNNMYAAEHFRLNFWDLEIRAANLMGVVRQMLNDPSSNVKTPKPRLAA